MQQAESIQRGKTLTPEKIQSGDSARTKVRREILDESGVNARLKASTTRRRRDSGAMLLAVLFMMAMMVIVALAVAPAFIQQAKRDREEEMIHRGTEYARAIKKYYKKFGRYPANLEQLENTNQIRFLRQRFKDPLAKDGQWKLLHYGDMQALGVGGPGFGVQGAAGLQGGLQGANPLSSQPTGANTGAAGSDQGANTAPAGAQLSPQQQGGLADGPLQSGAQPGGGNSPFAGGGSGGAAGQSGFSLAPGVGQSSGAGGPQGQNTAGETATGQTGSNNTIFGNSGVGGQTFGGGPIVGVASKSKDPTIRIYNKKKTYDEWVFIYSPAMDMAGGSLPRGPYNGQSFGTSQFGTPPGQLNQGTQGNTGAPGLQPSGPTQQPGGFGQPNQQQNPQQNQQLTPGNQFPPDQGQPQ
jgi:type II secretory pathway pseudopilin PulG